MLHLSRFFFEKTPGGLRAWTDPYYLHALVRGMAGGGRYLYRLEEVRGLPALLVQTPSHPDLTGLPEGVLRLHGVKRLPPEAIREGGVYRFLVRANLRAPLPLAEARRRLEGAMEGGRVLSLEVRRVGPLWVRKPGAEPFPLDVVEGRGVLLALSPEALYATLGRGVGRGKAYGLGLVTLAPARLSGA